MAWRLVEVDDDAATDADLTDSELIGVSIVLARHSDQDQSNCYYRAWQKIQPQVQTAIG